MNKHEFLEALFEVLNTVRHPDYGKRTCGECGYAIVFGDKKQNADCRKYKTHGESRTPACPDYCPREIDK